LGDRCLCLEGGDETIHESLRGEDRDYSGDHKNRKYAAVSRGFVADETVTGKRLRCGIVNEQAKHKLPYEQGARMTAKFLLHEYIRRVKNGVWRDYEKPQVQVPTSGPYQKCSRGTTLDLRRRVRLAY
jgi:hypothetical protein